jgi:PAS domain S-box-containing protein
MRANILITSLFFLVLSNEGISQKNELTLQLKWWHQFQFAGYYAAVKQGYYEKEGLHVTLVPGDAKQIVTDEVLTGKATFGITGSDLLIDYAKGQPLVALGAVFQHSPYVIMSLPREHINSPSDLVGKSIMASENQGWVELKAIFLKEGIDLKKLSVVNHSWQNIDLIKGKVDAMTGYRSVEPYQLKQMGMQPAFIMPINYGIDFYGDILFTSRSYLEKNPDLVEKFRQASFLGWEYAMRHKEEICDYILTLPGVAGRNVTKAALLFEADEMEKLILPQLVEIGHMNEGRWNHILAIHQELGLIPRNTNLDKFIYQKKPSVSDSLKNIGALVLGSIALLFLIVVMYGFMVRKAVKRKTQEQRKALEALSSSEEKYRTLVEQASDGIVICTPDLRFIQANSAALNILGYTEEEFYQLQLPDILIIPENKPGLRVSELTIGKSMLTQRMAKRKNGSSFVVEIHSTLLSNGNFLGFVRDITEKKQAEEQLQKQERQLDLIYNKVVDCIFVLSVSNNKDFHFISYNQSFLAVTGLTESQVMNKNITEVIPQPSLSIAIEKYKEAITLKKTIQWQEETVYPSGKKTGIFSITPVFEKDDCIQLIGSIHDITETKELEKTLDKMYRLSRIGVWEYDVVLNKIVWSPVTREIHEVPADFEPSIEKGINFYKEGESREKITSAINKAIKDCIPFSEELQIVTQNGKEKWVNVIGETDSKDGRCIRIYGSFQDIDDRKKTEIAFISSLEERNTILESIGDAFFALDKNWIVTYWNKEAERMLATPKETIFDKYLWDVFPNSSNTESYSRYHSAMRLGAAEHFEDFYPKLEKWFEISAYPSPNGLSVYFKDITERKLNQEAIRISNERYNYVAKATNDSIWDWNLVTNEVVRSGDNFQRIFGYDPDEADKNNDFWSGHVHPDDLLSVINKRNIVLSVPIIDYWEDEYRFLKANGKYLFVYDKGFIIRNEQGKAIRMIGSISDISDRNNYEESLKSLNKNLAKTNKDLALSNQELEQFAYVASHDLQEPLRMVTSFLTQLDKKYHHQLDEKAHQYIHFAVDGARRMRQIILELLEFSRVGRHNTEKEQINLNDLMDEVKVLQKKSINEKNAQIIADQLPVIFSFKIPHAANFSKPDQQCH